MSKPLVGLRFAVAGAGRVGASIASWLVAAGAELVLAASRTGDSAAELCSRLGGEAVPLAELDSRGLDLLLIAVPDSAVEEVARTLAARATAAPGRAAVALHTAGALPASALGALKSPAAGFHPLKAFPRPLPDPAAARGVVFGLDGDEPALALAGRLLAAWGARGALIPPEHRRLYHFAATQAAGGVVTLVALAAELGRRLGLAPAVAAGYLELARGALAEVDPGNPAAAITGPVARGDAPAVAEALIALEREAPDLLPTAVALLTETLRQVSTLGGAAAETLEGVLAAHRHGLESRSDQSCAPSHDPNLSGTSEGKGGV